MKCEEEKRDASTFNWRSSSIPNLLSNGRVTVLIVSTCGEWWELWIECTSLIEPYRRIVFTICDASKCDLEWIFRIWCESNNTLNAYQNMRKINQLRRRCVPQENIRSALKCHNHVLFFHLQSLQVYRRQQCLGEGEKKFLVLEIIFYDIPVTLNTI